MPAVSMVPMLLPRTAVLSPHDGLPQQRFLALGTLHLLEEECRCSHRPVQQSPGLMRAMCLRRVWRMVPAVLHLGHARALGAVQEGRPRAAGHAPAGVQRQRALARLRPHPLWGPHRHLHRHGARPSPYISRLMHLWAHASGARSLPGWAVARTLVPARGLSSMRQDASAEQSRRR